MKVKELKEILNNTNGLSLEDFDDLDVLFTNDGEFFNDDKESSGVLTITETCDEKGKLIEDDNEPIFFFVLMSPQMTTETKSA